MIEIKKWNMTTNKSNESDKNVWAFEYFDNFPLLFGKGIIVLINIKVKTTQIIIFSIEIVHF